MHKNDDIMYVHEVWAVKGESSVRKMGLNALRAHCLSSKSFLHLLVPQGYLHHLVFAVQVVLTVRFQQF